MTNVLNYLKIQKIDIAKVGGIFQSFYLLMLSIVDEIIHYRKSQGDACRHCKVLPGESTGTAKK